MALRDDAIAIWQAGVDAVAPEHAVDRWLTAHASELRRFDRVWLVGVGKAVCRMAVPLIPALGDRLQGGLLTTKDGHGLPLAGVEVLEASHPVPDARSQNAAQRTIELARSLGPDELMLALISGGGSALWCLPAPGMSFEAVAEHNRQLLRQPIDIHAMNAARIEMSAIKGGRLAAAAKPAQTWSLVISDVPGDPGQVASGPTWPGGRRFVIADQEVAVEGAAREARRRGYEVRRVDGTGPHDVVRDALIDARGAGVVVLSSGEAEIAVGGSGLGGRNQHLALDLALELDGQPDWAACIGGTDGTDGPTEAAGGVVDGQTAARIRGAGGAPMALLADCNSHRALGLAGDRLHTGPTGTNVMDLRVLLMS